MAMGAYLSTRHRVIIHEETPMKIDLHVHSTHSKTPNDWVLRKLGARESYTKPMDLYRIAGNRGMGASPSQSTTLTGVS